MYFVYIIQSVVDNNYYTGYTSDLRRRLERHNSGYSKATKRRKPFKLVYCESFKNKNEAIKREYFLKSKIGGPTKKSLVENFTKEELEKYLELVK
jgi:putative endonuclease